MVKVLSQNYWFHNWPSLHMGSHRNLSGFFSPDKINRLYRHWQNRVKRSPSFLRSAQPHLPLAFLLLLCPQHTIAKRQVPNILLVENSLDHYCSLWQRTQGVLPVITCWWTLPGSSKLHQGASWPSSGPDGPRPPHWGALQPASTTRPVHNSHVLLNGIFISSALRHLHEIKMMICTNWEFQFSVFHSIFHLNLSFKERTYVVHRCHLFTFRLKAFPVAIIISNYLKLGTHHFLLAHYSSKARLMVRQQCILLPRQVIAKYVIGYIYITFSQLLHLI